MNRSTLLVASLVILMIAGFVPTTVAENDCDKAEGNGLTHAIGPNRFAGSVDDLTIDGELRPATVTVTVLEQRITEDGTIQATTSHVFELDGKGNGICEGDEDCFETIDHTVLDPSEEIPGLFRLNEVNRVASGTGEFADACGKFTTHGSLNFIGLPTAEWKVKGRICSCS